jgi:sortase A
MRAALLHSNLSRTAEAIAWGLGFTLLASYVVTRTSALSASEAGIDAMRSAQAAYSQQVATEPQTMPADNLRTAQPDTSTWSPKRLADYKASLANAALPQAVLRVPKLKLEVPVYEGTSERTLNRGAGHIEGTAHVGSDGNIGIAAHRDGFFRPLKDIAPGDILYLETVRDTREYRITRVHIVEPDDVSVLAPTAAETITLVTCYPFYHVGAAPLRFIVHAQRTAPIKIRNTSMARLDAR